MSPLETLYQSQQAAQQARQALPPDWPQAVRLAGAPLLHAPARLEGRPEGRLQDRMNGQREDGSDVSLQVQACRDLNRAHALRLMDRLENLMMKHGWPVPFTAYYLVHHQQVLETLDQLRACLKDSLDGSFLQAFGNPDTLINRDNHHPLTHSNPMIR